MEDTIQHRINKACISLVLYQPVNDSTSKPVTMTKAAPLQCTSGCAIMLNLKFTNDCNPEKESLQISYEYHY